MDQTSKAPPPTSQGPIDNKASAFPPMRVSLACSTAYLHQRDLATDPGADVGPHVCDMAGMVGPCVAREMGACKVGGVNVVYDPN